MQVATPARLHFESLQHGRGRVASWWHVKLAAYRPQFGLQSALPVGPLSH
jgi:hypothetical protein